jgi:hypothetical protein
MRAHLARRPVCLKDPRFTFTLPAWREILPPDAGFVCVFRDPARVAVSVMAEARREPGYFDGFAPTPETTWTAWRATYRAALAMRRAEDPWVWLDADALMDDGDARALAALAGVRLPLGRLEGRLRRSTAAGAPPAAVRNLHEELRVLARAQADAAAWVPGRHISTLAFSPPE